MPNVICDFTGCAYNAATVCTRDKLYVSEGYCMDSKDEGITGEVIESNELVYPEGIED